MKWLNDMTNTAKGLTALTGLMATVAAVVIWLFATFTPASAFGEFKNSQEKKDLYALRRTLRQDVEQCKQAEKAVMSDFMKKTCIDINEEYQMTVGEINARWGSKK